MQRFTPRSIVSLLVVTVVLVATQVIHAKDSADGWVTLFDGTTLDGWRGYKKDAAPKGWVIENGTLHRKGRGGDIMTTDQYGDFELTLDWKVAPGSNSGIMYRVTEENFAAYYTGPEYQVLDDDKHPDGKKPETSSGSLYALYPGNKGITKPVGEWNATKIVLNGNHVEHWLNGEKVVDATMESDDWNKRLAKSKFAKWERYAKNSKGHIVLQDHGAPVWYRNIKIRTFAEGNEPAGSSNKKARILFVTQSKGFTHSAVRRKGGKLSYAEQVMTELGVSSGGFRVECTQDCARDFTRERLDNADIVMFYTTGTLPIAQDVLDYFFKDWLRQPGHGFIGTHSAADTFHEYEPYWDMIGGTFNGHPWGAGETVTISVHDTKHPVAKPWGSEFVIRDEIYRFKNWQPEKVHVLMSLNMEKTSKKAGYHVPVCWVKNYGQGKVMHMSLGHREDVWSNPTYQQSLLAGVQWIMGNVEGDATPNPEVSAAEQKKAEAVVAAAK